MKGIQPITFILALGFSLLISRDQALSQSTKKGKNTKSPVMSETKNDGELRRIVKLEKEALTRMQRTHERLVLPVLSLEQVVHLEHWNRVRYLHHLRRSLLALAEFQQLFQGKVSSLDQLNKSKLWALFLGQDARAQEKKSHSRGRADDMCIYAGHLRKYTSGQGNFRCEEPAGKCNHPTDGNGFLCSFIGSGLNGDNACFPVGVALDSTRWCMKRAQELTESNRAANQSLIEEYVQFLKSKGSQLNALSFVEITQWAYKLSDIAYDPDAMAHLLKLAYANKTKSGNQSTNPLLWEVAKDFDKDSGLVDTLFAQYTDLCSRNLAPEVVTEIQANAKKEGPRWKQERDRAKLLSQLNDEEATVGNVLQKHECQAVDRRADDIATAMWRVNVTLPPEINRPSPPRFKVTPGLPPEDDVIRRSDNQAQGALSTTTERRATTPPKIAPADTPENILPRRPPLPPQEIPRARGETVPDTNLCGGPTGRDQVPYQGPHDNQLVQESFRCLICPLERDVIQGNSYGQARDGYATHGISKKWLALLSIMTKVCGDSTGRGERHNVRMTTALAYAQTFGHCHSGIYEWNKTQLKPDDWKKIEKWQLGDQEELQKGAKSSKFLIFTTRASDFKRLFGTSMENMKSIFCSKDSTRIPTGTSAPAYLAQRRQNAKKSFDRIFPGHATPPSNHQFSAMSEEESNEPKPGFASCFDQSYHNAEKLYGSSGRCRALVSVDRSSAQPSPQVARERPYIAVIPEGECMVSSRVSHDKKSGRSSLEFLRPGSEPAVQSYDFRSGEFTMTGPRSFNVAYISAEGPQYCPNTNGPRPGLPRSESEATTR